MIALEPQLEQQIKNAATIAGLSSSELIKNLFFEYQQEQEALKRAELSYAEYKKTGEPISLEQLIKNNDLENADERAFIDIKETAQYAKQLRSSAWNRSHKHD
ncbi:MAG: hypothetical protein GQ583_02920 [Methyloprofundus sp.]|nr:hypothetical protein [Methyloprofundus sp.]